MDMNRPLDSFLVNQRFGGGLIPPNPRSVGHRRAHSETFIRLPDELLFDSDPDFNISDIDLPSLSDDNASGGRVADALAFPASVRPDSMAKHPVFKPHGEGTHLRSLSVDTTLLEVMEFQGIGDAGGATPEFKAKHRYSSSTDGETSPLEGDSVGLSDYAKKAMSADKLAELALLDPKRAKRILANRQSAARSKERKICYTNELERKVQTLQTEATTLSAQLTLLQRDTTGLTIENRELKLRLQAMEQQAQLRDALNNVLRGEIQQLKMPTKQIPNMNENAFNGALYSEYLQSDLQSSNHQAHHLHLISHLVTPNRLAFNDYNAHDSMDLM